ncbi:hypothetical protein ACN27F_05955 [Solwaraspora sp. WMMB335]|uniref:hypothetical protein n=1 Tax=Solwaraspora sp. WMMB335 TaxID=3404118 RepID=UPI003B937B7C
MTTVSAWTGWEANALRKALRMSVTDFAEHLGAARRTVAKWSSRGRDIQLRAEMQAALDTVLAQASAEARQRFAQLCDASTSGAPTGQSAALVALHAGCLAHTDGGGNPDLDQDENVRRRDFLTDTAVKGAAAIPTVAHLLDVLLSPGRDAAGPGSPISVQDLAAQVAQVKGDYQACRYGRTLDRLVTLLPAFTAARSQQASERSVLDALAADLYHVVGSVLLKHGDTSMALVAAERSTRYGLDSGDPLAIGTSARIMTHALMSNGHTRQAVTFAQVSATTVSDVTGLDSKHALAVYGALLLRGSIAAARIEDRDVAATMLDEATQAANRLGHDGNDRWTGFGPTNVLQHRVNVALALGDAGTAITYARQVQIDKIILKERKAALFVDVAQAYAQWGRHEQGLSALRTAFGIAPEEICARPAVHRIVENLAALSRGHLRSHVTEFAANAGIRL